MYIFLFSDHKSKKFPVLVFIHGDSFEWSSGNPYDGRILASYGNIMVITVNYRLGILGFMKPSMTEYVYNNNGLLDQLAALQWIKDNIEDLNGDPDSVTLMGHGTGASCVSYLMLSPISNGLFNRAILMSGSALSDWALTKDPTQYTLQVAQSLGCNPTSKNLMLCLQNASLADIKHVQILAREFETPLGPVVAGSFIPDTPFKIMASYPNLLSKYQLLCGVTEYETYHDFGAIALEHGILETQRDDFITKFAKLIFEGAEEVALKEILKQYSPSKLDPQRWNVETNRDVILNLFSDARTLAPLVNFANYQSKANRQSYFYVFGHNSVSTHYAPLNKSVHGEELPYILGVPLGGTNTHFHTEYTPKEKLLSEAIMRLWTNFVKIGTPNTQSVNKYFNLDRRQWNQYNVEWPEYNVEHQSYLRLDIPPFISSFYRSSYTKFWIDSMPQKLRRYIHDPLYELTPLTTTQKPKKTHKIQDPIKRIWTPHIIDHPRPVAPTNDRVNRYPQPERSPETDYIYQEIKSINTPPRFVPTNTQRKTNITNIKAKNSGDNIQLKTSGSTITLIVSLGILFLAINVGICAILCLRKKKQNLRENAAQTSQQTRAEVGEVDVIGQKSLKEDKKALKTLKNSCSVIKSISLNKMRSNSQKSKKKQESCKTPKSDDSGGFRERFQLRRHLSTSTLDAHTKVRDWIATHRCSPNILRKSNTQLDEKKNVNVIKPFTRSEEILSDSKTYKTQAVKIQDGFLLKESKCNDFINTKTKTSNKNKSNSVLGSHSSISSQKRSLNSSIKDTGKSTDSLRSKGTESLKSKKRFQWQSMRRHLLELILFFNKNQLNLQNHLTKKNIPKTTMNLVKSQKRLSLQPTAFQTFRNFSGSMESESDYPKVPPTPPPRTTTCDEDVDVLEYDFNDDVEEDKLIQELVGGVESLTNSEDTLDSKGPATIFEKKMEIVPVKVNASYATPRTKEDYVCITDLHLPDVSDFERTAKIKPNYGINKLQQRSESIHRPPEKAVKVVQKGFMKPSAIIHRGFQNVKKSNERLKSDSSKLEHSNSGSSNDTETSTGTVKQLK
ncbi:hypothetical protein MSG28_000699 [Choristoneura fumiferana]|uniref:Uncharacterized protein n=1 Tax=Choristoneura fumiferana TaxID=7141 RepID=A0ACC0K1W5_CHOFU|nr:hypothetical protein MSG28_000699 [Choristoneura fumiferana]